MHANIFNFTYFICLSRLLFFMFKLFDYISDVYFLILLCYFGYIM